MSANEPEQSIWFFNGYNFYTKRDRDMFIEGYNAGLAEGEKRKKEFHIREDV